MKSKRRRVNEALFMVIVNNSAYFAENIRILMVCKEIITEQAVLAERGKLQ